jgi:tRNA A-37 threonylcarbamoyl transferase component Bud32/predicted RNA-binding Zn-ribbon protein involved in translation (DUF1610 family)
MTLSVVCASCGSRLKAPESSAGGSVKCPKCGKQTSVGTPAPAREATAAKQSGKSLSAAPAAPSKSSGRPLNPAEKDRNLLFGVLALQAAFIDKDQFAEVCAVWITRKKAALADLLTERSLLSASDRREVERLVERHLKSHDGDAAASLAAALNEEARSLLSTVDDAEVRRSLESISQEDGCVQVATQAYTPEARQRYTLTSLHAKGGFGQVWLARDAYLNREVALKELRPEREGSSQIWNRFVAEAQITGQLEHPGIVPVYELVKPTSDQAAFYTMRFVRGRTLSRAARLYHKRRDKGGAQKLDQLTLLSAFINVCNAVAYAHSRGVIHRDLKGANVILGDFGEAVVLDWGLAKVMSSVEANEQAPPVVVECAADRQVTMEGQAIGTPAYMAPEQARGRLDQIRERTDVYGLGTILYEILTGEPPFKGADTQELLRQVKEEEPRRPRQVAPGTASALEAICLKAMSKRSKDRYASAGDLAADVQRWLADEPVTAYREPLPRKLARWGRRHPAWMAAAAVLMLALLGGAFWFKHERDARAARAAREAALTEGEVQAALQDADQLLVRGRLDPARKAVERAQDRLTGGPGELQQRVRKARADLEMVHKLEQVLLLETFTAGKFENIPANAAYQSAFREYDLDLMALPAEEAAERIKACAIRDQLLTALDDWIFVKPQADVPGRDRLLSVARLADNDSWRQRLRDPKMHKDRANLEQLARSPEVAQQPPSILVHLGKYLAQLGSWTASAEVLRQAQRRHAEDFWVNYALAMSLSEQTPPRVVEALSYFRVAAALRPQSRIAHLGLARQLLLDRQTAEALSHFQQADQLAGAREPRSADVLIFVAGKYLRQNEFASAVEHFQMAERLLKPQDTRRDSLRNLIQTTEHYVQLAAKLPAIAGGEAPPDNPDDKIVLAEIAMTKRRLYALSARLYKEALSSKPSLAANANAKHRYNAACAAALAGTRSGEDTARLDADTRARWRKQALDWLRADLLFWKNLAQKNSPQTWAAIRSNLQHWRSDPDLSGIRDPDPLAKLSDEERTDWLKFWADVDALRKRVG